MLTVAPLKLLCPPNLATLRTISELGNDLYKQTEIKQVRLRKEAQYEINMETYGPRCSG